MIGERLKMLRKKKGLSQKDVGDMLGLKIATISLYECNKAEMSDENKIMIAKYYNVSLDYLLGIIDDEICCYNENKFLKYPDDITDDEIVLINEFIDFIYIRRNHKIT